MMQRIKNNYSIIDYTQLEIYHLSKNYIHYISTQLNYAKHSEKCNIVRINIATEFNREAFDKQSEYRAKRMKIVFRDDWLFHIT